MIMGLGCVVVVGVLIFWLVGWCMLRFCMLECCLVLLWLVVVRDYIVKM